MSPAIVLIAAAAVGVEAGWNELPEGGFEYVIQIEPQLLDSLRRGEAIASDIPPAMRGAKRYRIMVGKGPLPNQGPPPASPAGVDEPAGTAGSRPKQPSANVASESDGPFPIPLAVEMAQLGAGSLPSEITPPALPARNDPTPKEDERPWAGRIMAQPLNQSTMSESVDEALARWRSGPPVAVQPSPSVAADAPVAEPNAPADRWNQGAPRAAVGNQNEPLVAPSLPASSPAPLPDVERSAHRASQADYVESPAAHVELPQADSSPVSSDRPTPGGSTQAGTAPVAPRPWMPLVLVVLMLTVSLGGNAYLGWNWWDLRNRYRRARRQTEAGT